MTARFCSGFGQFHTNEPDPKTPHKRLTPYVPISMAEIRALVDNPQQVAKSAALWMIPSTLLTRNFGKQEKQGQFHLLWADLDENTLPLSDVSDVLGNIIGDADFEMYLSSSATPERQKARILLPLARPLTGVDYMIAAEVLNDKLEAAGIVPDRATERAAQLCYLPNRGEHYDALCKRDGVLLDPLTTWAEAIEAKRQAIRASAELRKRGIEAAEANRQQRLAGGFKSAIEAFNAVYLVDELLLLQGYDQRGDSFRHPASESGSYSASVKDGRVHSLSSNDPLYTGGNGGGAHDAFGVFCTLWHGGDRDAALKDAGDHWLAIDGESWNKHQQREFMQAKAEERRQKQREEAARIGEGETFCPLPEVLDVPTMKERFVFVSNGSRVFDKENPTHMLVLPDFKNHTTASFTEMATGTFDSSGKPKTKRVPNAGLWLQSLDRLTAVSTTFKAGAGLFVHDPLGTHSVNLWSGFKRPRVAGTGSPAIFINHVKWLFKERADDFLDWLAHIEQFPGVLPHTAWVHVSSYTGTGRNAMASILARVFAGYVATSLDLVTLLESGFNERLSRKVLAVVDEIREGGAAQWKHSEALKQMLTAEVRTINVKFGRQSLEHNACRFLLFSNHRAAIPLDDSDRRFEVVINDDRPMKSEYYAKLYSAIHDPEFIAAIADFLSERDLSRFNPGSHAKRTAHKMQLIESSTPDDLGNLKHFTESYPLELATADRLRIAAGIHSSDDPNGRRFRHIVSDAGWVKMSRKTINGKKHFLYAKLDHAEKWQKASFGFEKQLPIVDGGTVNLSFY